MHPCLQELWSLVTLLCSCQPVPDALIQHQLRLSLHAQAKALLDRTLQCWLSEDYAIVLPAMLISLHGGLLCCISICMLNS